MESSVPHCPTLIPAALGENLYSCSSVFMPSDTAIIFLVSLPFSPGNSSILDLWDFVAVLAALCISSPGHQALHRVFALLQRQGDCRLWPPLLLSLHQHLEAPRCSEGLAASPCVCEHIMQCEPMEGWCLCCQPPLKSGLGLLCGTQKTVMLCLSPSSQGPPAQPSPAFAA